MLKNFYSLSMLFLLLCCSVYAETTKNCEEIQISLESKMYITVDQILFENGKIFVAMDNGIYQTPAIHADENGYYVQKLIERDCSWYEWKCPKCHQCNWKIDLVCPCGYTR